MTTTQIIIVCCFGAALLGFVIAKLLKKDYSKFLSVSTPVITCLYQCLQAVSNILPTNEIMGTIILTCQTAIKAATYAEEMWLSNNIIKEDRAAAAQRYIDVALDEAGIQQTESLKTIISGIIALTCFLLPHHEK